MPSTPSNSAGIVNPPNTPSNPSNQYLGYTVAHEAALAISRTNPEIRYYLCWIESNTYSICTMYDDITDDYYLAGVGYTYTGQPI